MVINRVAGGQSLSGSVTSELTTMTSLEYIVLPDNPNLNMDLSALLNITSIKVIGLRVSLLGTAAAALLLQRLPLCSSRLSCCAHLCPQLLLHLDSDKLSLGLSLGFSLGFGLALGVGGLLVGLLQAPSAYSAAG